jgi:hypothetical protein
VEWHMGGRCMTTVDVPHAIPTAYRGYRFRSRLEARWAVFLDAIGIKFEYEVEGFELGRGIRYLPDFLLTDMDLWLEVKGERPALSEFDKCRTLARITSRPALIAFGPIELPNPHSWTVDSMWLAHPDGAIDTSYWWTICPKCERPDICRRALVYDTACGCSRDLIPQDVTNPHAPPLVNAYARARSARFEFGEQG